MCGTCSVVTTVHQKKISLTVRCAPYLRIAQHFELLSAAIKLAGERFILLMNNLMREDISILSKGLAADDTAVGPFSIVSPLVRLDLSADENSKSIRKYRP